MNDARRWIIGVTGASGTIYGRRLVEVLLERVPEVSIELIISEPALRVMREEETFRVPFQPGKLAEALGFESERVKIHNNRDIGARIASGSYPTAGMVVIPCSMSSLAAIASGHSQNLIHRAADVVLKERRTLILVPRETPLSEIHLENMLKLAKLGVRIVPAMPGFYHQPKVIIDLVDMMVMRVLDQMGLEVSLAARWGHDRADCTQPQQAVVGMVNNRRD